MSLTPEQRRRLRGVVEDPQLMAVLETDLLAQVLLEADLIEMLEEIGDGANGTTAGGRA